MLLKMQNRKSSFGHEPFECKLHSANFYLLVKYFIYSDYKSDFKKPEKQNETLTSAQLDVTKNSFKIMPDNFVATKQKNLKKHCVINLPKILTWCKKLLY